MKGLLDANKYDLAKFFVVRCTLTMNELIVPYIIYEMLNWLQSSEVETFEQTARMVMFGLLIPIIRILVHTIWEYFCF